MLLSPRAITSSHRFQTTRGAHGHRRLQQQHRARRSFPHAQHSSQRLRSSLPLFQYGVVLRTRFLHRTCPPQLVFAGRRAFQACTSAFLSTPFILDQTVPRVAAIEETVSSVACVSVMQALTGLIAVLQASRPPYPPLSSTTLRTRPAST